MPRRQPSKPKAYGQPTVPELFGQIKRNVSTLGALVQSEVANSDDHCDWKCTLVLYTAIAYVNAVLTSRGHYAYSHGRRNNLMIRDPELKPIVSSLRKLQEASRSARYECRHDFTHENFDWMLDRYDEIREVCVRLLVTEGREPPNVDLEAVLHPS